MLLALADMDRENFVGQLKLFKDDQGCRWVNTYVIGKDVREPADVQAVE